MKTKSPVFDAIKRGEDVTFVDGKVDAELRQNIQFQPSIQAVNAAIRVGTQEGAGVAARNIDCLGRHAD